MDIAAIVASAGSFVVSEKVIKAKSLVLFGLLCTGCYDLFIHSSDPITLRIYRGPSLFAITLIMTAFCLRSWRRNGIACDELIFLPGTTYAEKNISSNKEYTGPLPINLRNNCDEGEVLSLISRTNSDSGDIELQEHHTSPMNHNLDTLSQSSEILRDNQDEIIIGNDEKFELLIPLDISDDSGVDVNFPTGLWKNCRRGNSAPTDDRGIQAASPKNSDVQHQQIVGINRFFATKETNEYAPSGPKVASAGVDLFMPVLFNFHVFMVLTHGTDGDAGIPPQVLPLIFLSILMIRSVCPFGARRRFWVTVRSMVLSLFSGVSFRDEFMAEIATSMVRPLQDICFAIFYYVYAMYGIISGKIELEETGNMLKRNILLHNFVIPICAILPLIIRTLQTLRQAHDDQRRWPHMGNAFKYISASLVIFYGMTHSEIERSVWWWYSFAACVMYQIWWDIFIDWELIRIVPREEVEGLFCPAVRRIQLRSNRMFKNNRSYWRIISYNILFRFFWMISFIPAYHINIGSREMDYTFSSDYLTIVGFIISLGEMIRRCFWSLLRLELETLRKMDSKYVGNSIATPSSKIQYGFCAPKGGDKHSSQRQSMKWAAYRLMVKRLYFLELLIMTCGYVVFSLWVAAII